MIPARHPTPTPPFSITHHFHPPRPNHPPCDNHPEAKHKMETLTRTEINQANAQHSTGPTTEEGKKISSQNALRHGLTAQTVVLPTEDLTAYQAHLKSFQDEYSPKGSTESQLVQALADTSWRLNRVAVLENE